MRNRAPQDKPVCFYTETLLLEIPGFIYWGALKNEWKYLDSGVSGSLETSVRGQDPQTQVTRQ